MMIALYILGGLASLIGIVVLVAPTDYKLEREVTINKPKSVVFPYLRSLRNQDLWSTWNMKDPNMKKSFRGTDETVGFVAGWESDNKNVGKGEQEIKSIKEGERVDFELRFEKPWKATNDAYLVAEAVGNDKTKVKWGFSGKMKRPMNAMSVLMRGVLIKEFDQGLSNLKRNLEK
jgi:hypothetical protein